MQPEDMAHFARMMYEIGLIYRQAISAQLCMLYWRDLEHYGFAEIWKAWCEHRTHPKKGAFMPKPADIIHFLKHKSGQQADIAWQSVLQKLSEQGSYGALSFDDAMISRTLAQMGGIYSLSRLSYQQLSGLEKKFKGCYLQNLASCKMLTY